MRSILHVLLLGAALGLPGPHPRACAASWVEDFSTDPASRGWVAVGATELMHWDAPGQRLAVTWDSTRTNTFLLRPLGTVLTRAESFAFGFSLALEEIRTPHPASTFQIALGLLRRSSALRTNLFRGSGIHPVTGPFDIVEFNYFPASQTISPTVSAVAVGTNNVRWSMANLFPFELTPGNRFDITVRFTAADQQLALEVTRDGQPFASGQTRLEARVADFRVDAFSITSYSGAGQPAGYGGDVLAHGWVDDVSVEYPDPPSPRITLHTEGSDPVAQLAVEVTPDGWMPHLQTSTHAEAWADVPRTPERSPDGQHWLYPIGPAIDPARFFRIRLDRP